MELFEAVLLLLLRVLGPEPDSILTLVVMDSGFVRLRCALAVVLE